MVACDGWARKSRYPNGHLVKVLGNVGDKKTENEVLLLEHDVKHDPFSPKAWVKNFKRINIDYFGLFYFDKFYCKCNGFSNKAMK